MKCDLIMKIYIYIYDNEISKIANTSHFLYIYIFNHILDTMNCSGPGYRSPKAAMLEGPREKLMYVVCIHTDKNKSDVLCTVDIDPNSTDYCKV